MRTVPSERFLEEARKMYRLLIDLMGAADVREDGMGFPELW
ncbi:hypothetical protein ACQ0QQ_13395 [Lysinibacillus sphaericus]